MMKNKRLLRTMLYCSLISYSLLVNANVVEEFQDETGGFHVEPPYFSIENGRYWFQGDRNPQNSRFVSWSGGNNSGGWAPQPGHSNYFDENFTVSVEARWEGGSVDRTYGLFVCAHENSEGNRNFVGFYVDGKDGTGYGIVSRMGGSEQQVLVDYTPSGYIISGAANTFTIQKQGQTFIFKLNEQEVERLDISGCNGGSVGLESSQSLDVSFDNFRISIDQPPEVYSVSPLTATSNEVTTFSVTGQYLTSELGFSLTQCDNIIPLAGGTATQLRFQCTPRRDANGYQTGNILDSNATSIFPFQVNMIPLVQRNSLTVNLAGTGTGSVSGLNINCGGSCYAEYDATTQVTLTATAGYNSSFQGWSGGACIGKDTCTLTMNQIQKVTATFQTCSYNFSPFNTVSEGGGQGTLKIQTPTECAWTAVSQASWLNIITGASGKGEGTVTYAYAQNPNRSERQGQILIANREIFTVTQENACIAILSPGYRNHTHTAIANNQIQVQMPINCSWAIAHKPNWVTIEFGQQGQGNGTISYAVSANTEPGARGGTIEIAGSFFTVSQDGQPCQLTPIISASATRGYPPFTVTLDGRASYAINGGTLKYHWQSSDGQSSTQSTPSFTFDTPGNYLITLTVIKDTIKGCSASDELNIMGDKPTTRLTNLSTRAPVEGQGAYDIIAGFGTAGTGTQDMILRGWRLEHIIPKLKLETYPDRIPKGESLNCPGESIYDLPAHLQSSDTCQRLNLAGVYTATLMSTGATGLGLIGVDAIDNLPDDQSPPVKLINLSTRAPIRGGAYDIIAGFTIKGKGSQKLVIRGWALENGVDPFIKVEKLGGEYVDSNNNWLDHTNAKHIPEHMKMPKPTDAAIFLMLPAGTYTATLSSVGKPGLGLIGVDAVD
jgi:PKD repeat protein